ncbi:NAD-dependent protein deacetylase sirtuin-1 [Cichlidogyrus casuarinus]|uniref:protein acetyllysine N-acetyltransferase n=1 Tax=Cichlidogyrus casuarinus TaxID=1844966 RepID=A0ABD2QBT0_9PLAT
MIRLERLISAGFINLKRMVHVLLEIDENCVSTLGERKLLQIMFNFLSTPLPRIRLPCLKTMEEAIEWITKSQKIIVLTGAGVSVSCGIPDFRSKDGIYSRLAVEYPDLKSPQDMFDLDYFLHDPQPFFKFAKEIYPGQFEPSISHKFISLLDSKNKLLRNFTQNIDTLEQEAGIKKVVQCHGCFSTASCLTCRRKFTKEDIRADILAQTIPRCPSCKDAPSDANDEMCLDYLASYKKSNNKVIIPSCPAYGVIKPDIVFFGEDLPEHFHDTVSQDVESTDLVIVMGSSLKVRPVSCIPSIIPQSVPQLLINREPLSDHEFDLELYGDCDVIVTEFLHRLGWSIPDSKLDENYQSLEEVSVADLLAKRLKIEAENKMDKTTTAEMKVENKTAIEPPDETQEKSTTENKDSGAEPIVVNDDDESSSSCSSNDEITWSPASLLEKGTYSRVGSREYVFTGSEYVTLLPDSDAMNFAEEEQDLSLTREEREENYIVSLIEQCENDPILAAELDRSNTSSASDLEIIEKEDVNPTGQSSSNKRTKEMDNQCKAPSKIPCVEAEKVDE